MKKIKVIITSAGSGPGIAVIKALKTQTEIPLEIIAMDMDILSAGLYLSDHYAVSPSVDDDSFIDFMINYCLDFQIDFIIPILDIETMIFAKNRNKFKNICHAEVLVNDYNVISKSNDKRNSHQHCLENNILVPKVYDTEDVISHHTAFPLILKPVSGVGSTGITLVHSERQLASLLPLDKGFLLQEFIEGREYTIDSISDLDGRCLAALPRERLVVKAGQSVKGRTVSTPELLDYGHRIAESFKLKGPGCSQCKVRDGQIYFIEMNSRYGTGVSLSIGAGLNIPLLHLKLSLNMPIGKGELTFKNGLIMIRFWNEIFLDGNEIDSIV